MPPHLERVPPTLTLRFVGAALEPQRLPPLPTTALHGALGHRLRSPALQPPPAPAANSGEGVSGQAPSPIALAAERMTRDAPSVELREGETIAMLVTLIGRAAIAARAEVEDAVAGAFAGGLGVGLDARTDRRPPLALIECSMAETQAPEFPPGDTCRVLFLTPARLTEHGRSAPAIDADLLWRSVLRRADTLARLYGNGPLLVGATPTPPFVVDGSALDPVAFGRYSSRQEQRMTWPAVLGSLRLRGDLPSAWQLLRYSCRVQIGKGTGFGFGRIALTA